MELESTQSSITTKLLFLKQVAKTITDDAGTSTTIIPGLVTIEEKAKKKNDVKARNLEQIHEDDLEEIDLKWQLALLSMRAKRFFQKTGKKITINGSDITGYDKSKVECFNCHKMRHFARECRVPRNQENRTRNQETTRRTMNVEDISSKAMVAIDRAGFDWSYMADDEAPTNMAFMALSDSESGLGYVSYNAILPPHTGRFSPPRINLSHTGLREFAEPSVKSYGVTPIEVVTQTSSVKISTPIKENIGASLIEDWESDEEDEVRSPPEKERKNVEPSMNKGHSHKQIEDQGYFNSGCSWYMTGNISYLIDFKKFDGGYVSFRGGSKGGKITGKATKDKTSRILKSFITEIENLVDKKVKIIRCDNGTNFKNRVMNAFCEEKGIKREYSVTRTPQQNRVAERRNKTMIKAARTMLVDSKLPIIFWAEVVNTACYVQNIVLVVKLHFKTPYELFRRRTPALSFMRPFGCHVTILTLDHLGKFNGKSDEGFFVGYFTNSKAFRVYNTRTRKVEENLHIKFLENKPLITGDGSKWLFDIDTLTESINYVPVSAGTHYNDFAGKGASFNAERPNDENSTKNINTVRPSINTASLNINTASPTVNTVRLSDDCFAANNDMRRLDGVELDISNLFTTYPVPTTPNTRINKDHSLDNVIGDMPFGVQTRRMIVSTDEQGFISAIYEEKTHVDLYTYLFACFLSQEEPKRITNALKDIAWVEAMQEELLQFHLQKVWTLVDLPRGKRAIGIKWVFQNKKDERGIVIRNKARLVAQGCTQEEVTDYDEVFAPVARIKTIRLFLAYASFIGFLVYQMDVKSAFLYGRIKEEVYMCQPLGFEDLDYLDKVYKLEKALYGLHQAPRAWYETLAKYLLDNRFRRGKIDQTLFIKRQKEDILLIQVYVDDIIFGSTKKELCTEFEVLMNYKFQMGLMGELTFFLGLQVKQKSDRIFISQDKYVDEILRKFKYEDVKPSSTPMDKEKALLKDSDGDDVDVHLYRSMISDYARAILDRKSTSGGCQFLSCRLISWQCKKQTVVATFTTKAEYVAAASCCGQVLWIQNQLLDYGRHLKLADADGISTLPITEIFEQLALMGYVIDSNKLTFQKDEAITKEMHDGLGRATTTASSLAAEQGSGNISKTQTKATPSKPSSLRTSSEGGLGCHFTLGSSPVQARPKRLSNLPNKPPLGEEKVTSLGNELTSTKAVYNKALVTLAKKVKKLEKKLKHKGRRAIIDFSDDAELSLDAEASPKQGRMIVEIDKDENVNLVKSSKQGEAHKTAEHTMVSEFSTASSPKDDDDDDDDTTLAKTLLNIQRSAAKDKGKAQKLYAEELAKETARQEHEKYNLKKALELQKQLDERIEDKVRKNMCTYLKNQGGYKQSYFKGLRYEDIKPIFERVWDQNHTFVPKDSVIEKEVMKRSGFDLQQESFKKQKLDEQIEVQVDSDQEEEDMKKYMKIVPDE
nr:hypothetical protein [Tanacetum cinerariifolium]